ncbi:MAG: hypothetical protein KGM24_14515 [Elusimicrobia bacterium]|nr:hypothetical protein [Elusimicrobiota bacterium]
MTMYQGGCPSFSAFMNSTEAQPEKASANIPTSPRTLKRFRSVFLSRSVEGIVEIFQSVRYVRFEAEFLETHRRFVLDGLAAAVLPDFTIREERRRGLVVELPGPPLGREIYFLKRRGRPLPAGVDLFLKTLSRTIADLR